MINKHNTVIITGANGNIGSALALRLAEEKNHLILLYHNTENRIEQLINKFPDSVTAIKADIKNLKELESSVRTVLTDRNLNLKALIHTAAIRSIDSSSLADSSPALWRDIIETNLIGTYNILKALSPLFIEAACSSSKDDYRRIVLLGSDVSRTGLPCGTAYAASKAALANLARSVSSELADYQILVNTVSPGPVKIDDSHFPEEYRRFRTDYYKMILSKTPLKKIAEISDIVSVCLFLISEENKHITGEEIFITGGKL